MLQPLAIGAFADKDKPDIFAFEQLSRLQQRVPSAVEAEIARVNRDKRKPAANFLSDRMALLRECFRDHCSIADDHHALRLDAFTQDSLAHIVA